MTLEWCARPRIAGQVDPGERVVGATVSGVLCGSGAAGNREFTTCNIDCWVWEFPPRRPTARGRKRYRRGSALATPGVILQKGWLQVCKCMPWSDALGVEMREGKRACVGGIGPPQKCGAFDMQELGCLVCRVATGRHGCRWAMREFELSTARCMQVTFLDGPGCGRCVVDLPVTKSDPHASGKKRTHTCACSTHPFLGMRPLRLSVSGKTASKRAATAKFQGLAELSAIDTKVTRACLPCHWSASLGGCKCRHWLAASLQVHV